MRRLGILAASLCLALLATFILPVVAEAKPKPPTSLREVEKRLASLNRRVEALIREANRDPDERKVEEYANYTAQQLKKQRRRIRAADLVKFMLDPKKGFPIRERCMKVIHNAAAIKGDPDLSATEKQGSRTKRSAFCTKYLVKELKNDDRYSRALTDKLLKKLWLVSHIPEIQSYSPLKSRKATWDTALREWRKYLKRQ